MKRVFSGLIAALGVALILAGCGKKSEEASSPPVGSPSTETPPGSGSVALVSAFDSGPRAAETPIDASQAKLGETLFQKKGCVVCHGFGKRVNCPDLNGVTSRRTAQWMENQILHPDKMTKEDPIAHQLFVQYKVQMTNLGLTSNEAKSLIEFLKQKNRETK